MTSDHKHSGSMISRYGPSSHHARLLCYALLTLLLLAGIIALILYLVYRPSKPRFTIAGVAVYQLSNSTSSPSAPANAISANLQFTILSRNPNTRTSILYDRLSAYVTYRNQPITPPAQLPILFQDREGEVAVSPVLGGTAPVPVSGDVAAGLVADEAYGVVGLRVVMMGRLKYRSGPFRSGWYGLYVRCDVLVALKKGCTGQVPLLGAPECDVDV